MTPTESLDQAIKQSLLISPWRGEAPLFVPWLDYCREAEVPCTTLRLMSQGNAGALRVTFPRRRSPSPDCQANILQAMTWQTDDRARLECCKHEASASMVRADVVVSLVEEVLDLWRADMEARS